jgi:hypothetical protein
VRSSKTKTRDAYRRAAPTEPLLLRASARSESWSHFGRSAITLRVPFRSGQSRRARQRVPSSFTSAETVFLRSLEREKRSRYVLPTNATQNLTNCTRARCFGRSVDPICEATPLRVGRTKKIGTGEIDAFHDAFDRFGGNLRFLPWNVFGSTTCMLFASLGSSPAFAWSPPFRAADDALNAWSRRLRSWSREGGKTIHHPNRVLR